MAKPKRILLTGGVVGFLYESEEKIPWAKIEMAVQAANAKVQVKFSKEERREIFHSTEHYFEALSEASNGVPLTDFEHTREQILKKLKDLHSTLAEFTNANRDSDKARLLGALHMVYSSDDLDVSTILNSVSHNAAMLAHRLRQHPTDLGNDVDTIEVTNRDPEVVALEAFIRHVLFAAKKRPAISNPGYRSKPLLHEFIIWSIPIGPRQRAFRAFASTLLGKNFSENAIRNAFRAVRSEYKTLDEIIDRQINGGK